MDKDYLNISSIETHLDSVIRKNLCKKCYAGTLPETLTEGVTKYVLIDVGSSISDFNAYGNGIVNIYLYAKPAKGMKNVAALSLLEKDFNKILKKDMFDNEHYTVARETAYTDSGYDNTYSMHYIIKAIRLTII